MRTSTTAAGYGYLHQQARKRWAPLVATGTVCCARPGCGRLIAPGEAWDLGHDDDDRTVYRGPEHATCNRRAGAIRGNRARGVQRRSTSLEW